VAGLFRDEVLQERQTQFLGTIRIARNPSFTLVTAVSLLFAAALVAYACWGEVTRKARLSGVLAPVQGTPSLSAPQAGHVTALAAHLFAPGKTAGFVRAGQAVWLRYTAYPYQKFGMAKGAIETVSPTPLNPQDLPASHALPRTNSAPGSEPVYQVTVALESQAIGAYGETQPLKAGMTLEADVIQERRRIWEWLLEPVLAASGLSRSAAGPAR